MAKYVNYEKYWQRRCKAHYKMLKLSDNDVNWKSAYLERHLQNYMENFTVSFGQNKNDRTMRIMSLT